MQIMVIAAALRGQTLAGRQQARDGYQDDLQPLHDAVLAHQPRAEMRIMESQQHEDGHRDDARQEGNGTAAEPSQA
jgi:hypothetical protein